MPGAAAAPVGTLGRIGEMFARLLLIVFISGRALAAPPDAPPLPGFLPPRLNFFAANTELAPPTPVASTAACAASCLATPACISINVCAQADGSLECGLSGWSMAYDPAAASTCVYYRRSIPRNDTQHVQAVPWVLSVPSGGVVITGGPFADTFNGNLENYLRVRDPQDMLHFFGKF
jgi:hypothetical protein